MRHVLTDNSTIAKLSQNHARNKQHNFYFTGNTIYSYGEHFPIAIIDNRFDRKFVIYNSRTYSMTTNRHQSDVYWAIRRHLTKVPRLELPLSGNGVDFSNWFDEQKDTIYQLILDLNNPRKIYTERTILELETQREPTVEIQDIISKAIEAFEADS